MTKVLNTGTIPRYRLLENGIGSQWYRYLPF